MLILLQLQLADLLKASMTIVEMSPQVPILLQFFRDYLLKTSDLLLKIANLGNYKAVLHFENRRDSNVVSDDIP